MIREQAGLHNRERRPFVDLPGLRELANVGDVPDLDASLFASECRTRVDPHGAMCGREAGARFQTPDRAQVVIVVMRPIEGGGGRDTGK